MTAETASVTTRFSAPTRLPVPVSGWISPLTSTQLLHRLQKCHQLRRRRRSVCRTSDSSRPSRSGCFIRRAPPGAGGLLPVIGRRLAGPGYCDSGWTCPRRSSPRCTTFTAACRRWPAVRRFVDTSGAVRRMPADRTVRAENWPGAGSRSGAGRGRPSRDERGRAQVRKEPRRPR